MGTYHPLTEYQRYQMYALKKAGAYAARRCVAADGGGYRPRRFVGRSGAIEDNAAIVPIKTTSKLLDASSPQGAGDQVVLGGH